MAKTCNKCGESAAEDAAFCENCGNPLSTAGLSIIAAVAPGGGDSAAVDDELAMIEVGPYAAAASHRGRRHLDNQDAVAVTQLGDAIVLAVADGVSTSIRARDASDTAVRVATEYLRSCEGIDAAAMRTAVARAHEEICKLEYVPTLALAEPQTTIVIALARGTTVWYAWVGDSRLYSVTEQGVIPITEDDSWLSEQVKSGVPLAIAIADPNAHCITQCLGMRDEDPEIHAGATEIPEGGWLVLCSDGLWNYLEPESLLLEILRPLDGTQTPADKAQRLVHFANDRGGQDNVTVALLRCM